ncbi:hypothetical protein [Larkinella soli]|uniref:hypothetical protein n=1 Tax=Larkinella soli TaxID=1770527 RepID=UPI000FFB9FCB|nr:hypothetical protein [Larkinella soli]
MNRNVANLVGPELIWLVLTLLTAFLAARNQPTTEAGNDQLLTLGWLFPLLGVSLSFTSLAWAPGNSWWWLLRIGLACGIGLVFLVTKLVGGIDYHDSRNSGVGTAYIMYIIFGLMELFLGIFVAVFFLLTRWSFLPVVKWFAIIVCGLTVFWGIISWLASFGKQTPS